MNSEKCELVSMDSGGFTIGRGDASIDIGDVDGFLRVALYPRNCSIPVADVYETYYQWCAETGHRAGSRYSFLRQLRELASRDRDAWLAAGGDPDRDAWRVTGGGDVGSARPRVIGLAYTPLGEALHGRFVSRLRVAEPGPAKRLGVFVVCLLIVLAVWSLTMLAIVGMFE